MKRFKQFCAIGILVGAAVASQAALVHRWSFEGNESDTSGSGNNGTITAAATNYVAGKFGQAISLGSGESVDNITAANLPTAGNADWSINLWLSINSEIPGLGYIGGFGSRTDPADRTERGFIAFAGDGNDLYFWGSSADRSFAPASYIVDGQFHMYTFTYKASLNELRAYVDGVLVGSGSPGNTFLVAASEVHLSGSSFWNQQFAGAFDEFSIWSQTLSAAQVGTLFSSNTVPVANVSITVTPTITFAGSNVVCNAVATGLTAPVTYQWQKGTNGNFVNLVNGGNVSGATTSNLTLVATLADNADFRVIATGVATSVTNDPVPLRVLSGLLDVSAPGDTVAIVVGSTPGPENVTHAIDNNTDKYFNWDTDATPPFSGPLGFTIQPSLGNTIVSGLRFYTANDQEGRDPTDYLLEGSLDGAGFTTIASGPLALPSGRNAGGQALNPLTQNMQEVLFANANGYTHYRLTFSNVKNPGAEGNTQLAEVEFLGVVNPNPPPNFTVTPANTTVNEGTSATFTSLATGPGPLTYQWFDVTAGDPGVLLSGQTNQNLTLASVSASQNGNRYRVRAINPNGTSFAPSTLVAGAQLTVNSGPIVVAQDLPAELLAYAGRTVVLQAGIVGTAPTYQWQSNGVNLVNGGRISGANSNVLTIANLQVSDAASYQLLSSNSFGGPVPTTATALYATAVPSFQNNGLGWALNPSGGVPSFAGDVLTLTTAGGQAAAAWFKTPMYIEAFKASFLYQDVTVGGADGITFALQNSAAGTNALGVPGGGLGYAGINNSVALTFNIWADNVVGIAFRTNGVTGTPYVSTAPVDFSDGNPIQVELNYANGSLQVMLSNTVTLATFTTNLTTGSLPTLVGTNVAYVGLTAATGGASANQTINNFRYVPVPTIATTSSAGTLLLSWPGTIGGYNVASNATVTGNYVTLPGVVGQTNGVHQKSVPSSSGTSFLRLALPLP